MIDLDQVKNKRRKALTFFLWVHAGQCLRSMEFSFISFLLLHEQVNDWIPTLLDMIIFSFSYIVLLLLTTKKFCQCFLFKVTYGTINKPQKWTLFPLDRPSILQYTRLPLLLWPSIARQCKGVVVGFVVDRTEWKKKEFVT